MRRAIAPLLAAAALHAGPALASTMPVLGLEPGQKVLSLGVPGVSADLGVRPGLSLGLAAGYYLFVGQVSARATWTLWQPAPGVEAGLLASAGGGFTTYNATDPMAYALGAYVVQAHWGPTIWRGTLGPGLILSRTRVYDRPWDVGVQTGWRWPIDLAVMANLELAVPLGGSHELTIGGNSIAGWRGRW